MAKIRNRDSGSAAPIARFEVLSDLPPAARAIAATTFHSCRWPQSDPRSPDFALCGCRAVAGKPYCPEHARQAFVQPVPRRAA